MKTGDKVIYTGKDKFYNFTNATFIRNLDGGRCEVKPEGCRFVTCDPPQKDIKAFGA